MSKRLFLAVNLSITTTRRIADAVDRLRRAPGPKTTWIPAPNLHVTLKFLGWTHEDTVGAVRAALEPALAGRKPFDVEAVGAGAFPSAERARVLWVGVKDAAGALDKLAADVEARMVALGFPREERAYHPHVTIGRVKTPADCAPLLAPVASLSFGTSTIREVTLFESVMKSVGSEYTPLFRLPFASAPPRTERQTRGVEDESSPDVRGEAGRKEDAHGGNRSEGA
jgi:2'-5' RNA ligase